MAKIKCRLKTNATNASIFLQLSMGRGKVYERKTGWNIDSRAWSKETGYPKQNLAEHKKLAQDIKGLELAIYKEINKAETKGDIIDGNWLSDCIDVFFGRKSEKGYSESVIFWIDHILENAELRRNSKGGLGLSKSRIQQYKQLKDKFAEFQGNKSIRIKEIDQALGQEFFRFLYKTKNYSESYSLKILENLKSVCYEAGMYVEVSPQLRKIKSGKVKSKFIVYLSPEELKKIADAPIMSPHLINARKWLILGCWVGQRGSDLLKMTEDSIKEEKGFKYFQIIQGKTGKRIQVPLLPEAQRIIETGFPHRIAIQNLNNYIKEVGKIAGIDQSIKGSKKDPATNRKVEGTYPKYELLGTHVCRRSFCTNLYGELPTPVIMQASGHSTEKVFLGYIGKSGVVGFREHWQRLMDRHINKERNTPQLKIITKSTSGT
ncbi:tyrosine-type recombinase/integrase [Robiginitalea sediminis]|uniref:tyrosine-type recombinase/integrase n=1 Tax=Robiginitalea sediminis TaxID=1982593 RepID=UPI001303EA0B|nr:phage integrase SAM-like domain-containing protein [Robiginitalea sediminis]